MANFAHSSPLCVQLVFELPQQRVLLLLDAIWFFTLKGIIIGPNTIVIDLHKVVEIFFFFQKCLSYWITFSFYNLFTLCNENMIPRTKSETKSCFHLRFYFQKHFHYGFILALKKNYTLVLYVRLCFYCMFVLIFKKEVCQV